MQACIIFSISWYAIWVNCWFAAIWQETSSLELCHTQFPRCLNWSTCEYIFSLPKTGFALNSMFMFEGLMDFLCIYRNLNHNQLSGDITDIFSNLPSLTTVWVFPLSFFFLFLLTCPSYVSSVIFLVKLFQRPFLQFSYWQSTTKFHFFVKPENTVRKMVD